MIAGYRRQKKVLCLDLEAYVPTQAIEQANLLLFYLETFLSLEKIILIIKTTFIKSLRQRARDLTNYKKIL